MSIHHGDCVEVMAAMPEASIDAIVTDPPYGIGFMGKEWDDASRLASVPPSAARLAESGRDPYPKTGKGPTAVAFDGRSFQSWCQEWAAAALRVAKPGAYLLAFGGTRTVHRMTVALEDAGWVIRDMLVWAYASGFPKSRALLKPAWEPIVMARKPGPLRELDIDGCRIGTDEEAARTPALVHDTPAGMGKGLAMGGNGHPAGRWPANIVLTDPIFDGDAEGVVGGGETGPSGVAVRHNGIAPSMFGSGGVLPDIGYGDTGTYSRFFLIPKASRSDREPVLPGMLEERGYTRSNGARAALARGEDYRDDSFNRVVKRANTHPTVKPVDLMRHLVRLVTPVGGTVLDPFLGSGTTALAAEQEGRAWVGIEREAEYVAIAEARLSGWQRGLGLSA